MKKTWGRFFRRKSITDRKLQEDYPTNSDSNEDDIFEDEAHRQEWQRNFNRRASSIEGKFSDRPSDIFDDNHWEYESEYNYSFGSDRSIIDAYKERNFNEPPRLYSNKDIERRIEIAMRNEMNPDNEIRPDRRNSRYPNDNRKDRFGGARAYSPVLEKVRQFERNEPKRRASNAVLPSRNDDLGFRRESCDNNFATWNASGEKRKVKKQVRKRRRAKDVSSDYSDEDNAKYTVNLTMNDLNDLIKKNINSAVKTIVAENTKPLRRLSPTNSLSTETETIFSGSSSHSTELPAGLLQKQIRQQLDKDNLRGIIKSAVAQEASDVLQKSFNASPVAPAPVIPTINEIPPSPVPSAANCLSHLSPTQQQTISHYPSSPQLHHGTPPPPPPPPTLPSVSFNIQHRGLSEDLSLYHQQRRHSLVTQNLHGYAQDHCGNLTPAQQDPNFNNYNTISGPQGAFSRLNNRRHTLAALDRSASEISAVNDGLDKIEQFNNALKLLDKTINQAENNSSKGKESEKEPETINNGTETRPNSGALAPLPGGVLAPVLSIADQIAALSKKEEKPLEEGQIPMSSCARAVLVLSNFVFLAGGGGLIAVGVWMMLDPNIETYFEVLNVSQNSSPFKMICYALIAVGSFGLLIALLGCCGVLHKSKCLLTLFLIMVGVLTVLEIGLGVMVMLSKESPTAIPVFAAIMSDMEENLRKHLKHSLVGYYMPETLVGTAWDMIQIELECCGATGPTDYKTSLWTNETRPETDFPDTCCVLVSKEAEVPEPSNKLLCHFNTAGFYYKVGCYDKMIGWFKDNSMYITIVCGGILAIEIFCFIAAFVICKKGKQKLKQNTTSANKPG